MHPTLMTQFAEARALALRSSADERRRGRVAPERSQRRFSPLRARRSARVAHA